MLPNNVDGEDRCEELEIFRSRQCEQLRQLIQQMLQLVRYARSSKGTSTA